MKYKVGDTVRIREWDDMAKEYDVYTDGDIYTPTASFVGSMKKYCGKTAKITAVSHFTYSIDADDGEYRYTDEMFVAQPQLIIEHHGRTTVAHIGKTYGVARCNPSDKYDAMTGDILAVQRLYAKKHIVSTSSNRDYGIIGTPTVYHDTNTGETLNIGDCVEVLWNHRRIRSFVANDGADFIMGLHGEPQGHFDSITKVKVDDDREMKSRGFKVVPR